MIEQQDFAKELEVLIDKANQYSKNKEIVINALKKLSDKVPDLLHIDDYTNEWWNVIYDVEDLLAAVKNLHDYRLYSDEKRHREILQKLKVTIDKIG
jgi:GTP1/Obg family GTP-binding protein